MSTSTPNSPKRWMPSSAKPCQPKPENNHRVGADAFVRPASEASAFDLRRSERVRLKQSTRVRLKNSGHQPVPRTNASGATQNYRSTSPASAEKSIGAKSFARNLGYAAAAIIAALSVESGRDGKYTGNPSFAASRSKVCRSSALAATPPVTNNVATL